MHFILYYMGKTHFTLRQKVAQVLGYSVQKRPLPTGKCVLTLLLTNNYLWYFYLLSVHP